MKAPRGKGTGSRRSKAKTSLRSLLGDVTKGRWRTRSVALHFSEGGQVPNMYIFKSMVDDIDQSIANDPSVKSAPVEGNSVTLEGDNFEGKNNVVRIGVRRWTNKGVEINTSTEFVISFKTAGAVEQFTRWVEWSSSLVSAKHQKRKEASRSAASKSRAAELEVRHMSRNFFLFFYSSLPNTFLGSLYDEYTLSSHHSLTLLLARSLALSLSLSRKTKRMNEIHDVHTRTSVHTHT